MAGTYDLVLRGGTCFDGLGSEPIVADVAIADGTIVEVGRVSGPSTRTIDADGLFVAPGFIDGHTHLDAQIFWDPHGANLTGHGVTSALMGNCGFTLAPGTAEQADLVVRSIERAEEMSPEAIGRGVAWSWSGFPGYLDAVAALPKALNIAAQVGHSAIRVAAMGERAFTDEATDDDLARMELAVGEAMAAGSLGFSTSRSSTHVTTAGTPVPSRLASWAEVRRLVLAMAATGTGIFQFAPERPTDPDQLADFRTRLGALAAESGRPVTFLVGGQEEQLATLDAVLAAGGRATGQVHVRGFDAVFGFKTGLPFDHLEGWRQLRAEPLEVQRARLGDPEVRRRLVEEAEGASYPPRVGGLPVPNFEEMTVADGAAPEVSVAELARRQGTTPVDAFIEVALRSGLEQLFRQPQLKVPDDQVLAGLRHPHTVVAASDAGAHVSRVLDANIPTYLLSHWVRAKGALSWEQAIRMLTSLPASVWGFERRGVLQPGNHADVVVFDPDAIGCGVPTAVHALPDGGACLTQAAEGIRATIVGGEPVMTDGHPTDARPGRLLRGGR
jgi:N-acyl-D-amino-acid deacylase